MDKKKIFLNVISNISIALVIIVLAVTANSNVIAVFKNDKKPYYHGYDKTNVSIMINVYMGQEYIPEMLDVLDKYNCKATFFVGGSWAQKNVSLLKTINEKGHEIGNHGFWHKDHKKLSVQQNNDEIDITNKLLKSILGKDITLFAPPSGSFGNNMLLVCENLNCKVIMWSKDTIDWRDKDETLVYKRATKNVKAGDFILMHPTAHSAKALEKICKTYQELGIKSIIVSENLNVDTY